MPGQVENLVLLHMGVGDPLDQLGVALHQEERVLGVDVGDQQRREGEPLLRAQVPERRGDRLRARPQKLAKPSSSTWETEKRTPSSS